MKLTISHPTHEEMVAELSNKELGDILFYFQSMCNCVGTDIDEIRKLNIEKLTKRYPDGIFDKERSINRDEEIQNGGDKG